jgi:tetratricopeptide (TPR) repeat protein
MEVHGNNRRKARRFGWPVAAAMLALSAQAPAMAADSPEKNLQRLRQAASAADREDCPAALKHSRPLVRRGAASGLDAKMEALAFEIATRCEYQAKNRAVAYDLALRGSRLEHSSDVLWLVRLSIELDEKRLEAAVASVDAMTQGRGAALNATPVEWMWSLDKQLRDSGKTALRRQLLKVLASDSYSPEEYSGPPDGFRYSYAELLAEGGDLAAAEAIVRRLEDPATIAQASLEPRLRRFVPEDFDLRRATEKSVQRHKEAMARDPDKLGPLLRVAAELRRLGRPAESIALLEDARPRIDDPAAFSDREEMLSWWWDALGRAHSALGQYEQAVAAFRKGAAVKEAGNVNVSQTINLAAAQNSFGRGDAALETLKIFDDPKVSASPYGFMEMRLARGCAHAVAGRPAAAAADLAYARAHEKDHPEALSNLLLCVGDMDGAAASFIRRLENPEQRVAALLQLSDYDPPPVARPADPVASRLPALKARPDVRAAIAKAGGIRRFNIQPEGL